ncbi:YidC/Oxa1 family membrane protein insertase [Blautia liquoris]|uniref:YidC/Oxa1 family membrane protein insertase n=1 Tax=Blautia liquoris TaxID=2779518 RepID=A0A7M2RGE4_9FIRM|nr:YidC/Oxa1 family membrane protein insertase [Blautia liquoris]QOV19413.1 YidC/Oxa1 family membrane protein insertase [Blautia liquoris]
MDILLSKSTWFIIKWVCEVLGVVMNGIYIVLNKMGIPNIGLSIVIFTVIVYMILTPIQIKQQKFSKMTAVMQPELNKIQEKYKGKKDQNSQMKMQEETMAVYQKYGVSPTGSCLPLLIQMPIMFSLFQVIYHIPGYIGSVKNVFSGAVTAISGVSGHADILSKFVSDNALRLYSKVDFSHLTKNNITDILYVMKPSQWEKLSDITAFSGISDTLETTAHQTERMNMFLGMNITEAPLDVIRRSWASQSWLLLIGAVSIPVLAWFTQWISYKLTPQPDAPTNKQPGTMEQSMKMMNVTMPVMSAVFCLSMSIGMGIYWIAGAVIRSIQQVVINRQMAKVDIDDLIAANQDKVNKKRAKQGLPPQKITKQATMNVRNIEEPKKPVNQEKKNQDIKDSTEYYKNNSDLKPGSLASKANMVSQYDNKKKNKK